MRRRGQLSADSSSQYDAIRAYLKELDITDNVWIGLSNSAEKPNFTWTNFQPLSTEGHWQEAIPVSSNPLCVAMDPAKDFLWKPMSCGGPEVASFICELPIPEWAQGPRGCLLTELPSLTILYIPELSSLELTSDCGLDGTKRIACKGDADREEILNQLTCAIPHEDFEDKPTTKLPSFVFTEPSRTTRNPIWTSNTVDVDYGMPTRHRRQTEEEMPSTARLASTEMFEATNYDTQMTTSNILDVSTVEATERRFTSTPPEIEITDEVSTLVNDVTIASEVAEVTASLGETTLKGSIFTPVEDIAAEYPSAISQGQLFSIIENGTMFDIIELNETSERESETPKETRTDQQRIDDFKPSVKLTQMNEKNPKRISETKTKPVSKKDIYKNADPKKYSPKKSDKTESKVGETDDNKEVEIFPVINDPSIRLNRTFRKELPGELQKTVQDNEKNTTIALVDDFDKSTPAIIDPNLDMLNKNITENNESELIENDDSTVQKKQLSTDSSTDSPGNNSPSLGGTDAFKPNRQRKLTRPQRRPFYPYYFSRVLG